jgi:hypothetical protein
MFSRLASAGEREPDTYMPYLGHEAAGVVLLDDGGLLAMLRLDGMAWETAELDEINGRHSALNVLLRNIATDRLVLSSHVVRTMDDGASYPAARCRSSFAWRWTTLTGSGCSPIGFIGMTCSSPCYCVRRRRLRGSWGGGDVATRDARRGPRTWTDWKPLSQLWCWTGAIRAGSAWAARQWRAV